MLEIFKEDSDKKSSLRVALLMVTTCACLLLLAMGFHIIWYSCHLQSENIEWERMSIFLAGISALLGTVLYNKVKQKNIELTNNIK